MGLLLKGDCLDKLKNLKDNSIDSIVTDPPYGLSFMGKKWDYDVPTVDIWKECLRVLKPGGHLLAFGGTRTYHRLVIAIEDAGFEIRDQIQWIYGSGFPKSMDISKAIDKEAGAEREVLGVSPSARPNHATRNDNLVARGQFDSQPMITAPSTDEAKKWSGYGTALKPAVEPVVVASKPHDELSLYITELTNNLDTTLCQSQSFASVADKTLQLSLAEPSAESSIALRLAKLKKLTLADLSALMDMFPYESETNTYLSIVLSWKLILAEVSRLKNTFTTEMKSSLTIDLKILKSLAWANMQESITKDLTPSAELNQLVSLAGNLFYAVNMKLSYTQGPSAIGNAMLPEAPWSQPQKRLTSPICLARKPLSEKTVAKNVLKHGCGGLNIDGSRIVGIENDPNARKDKGNKNSTCEAQVMATAPGTSWDANAGRFPANILFDEFAAGVLDEQSGIKQSNVRANKKGTKSEGVTGWQGSNVNPPDDSSGASRFFATFKQDNQCDQRDLSTAMPVESNFKHDEALLNSVQEAVRTNCNNDPLLSHCLDSIPDYKKCILYQDLVSLAETPESIDTTLITRSLLKLFGSAHPAIDENIKSAKNGPRENTECAPTKFIYQAKASKKDRNTGLEGSGTVNNHATVKPVKLMEYLIKLVTPEGGTVLDPFMGSGTTGVAAIKQGFDFIGCEMNEEYFEIAKTRILNTKESKK